MSAVTTVYLDCAEVLPSTFHILVNHNHVLVKHIFRADIDFDNDHDFDNNHDFGLFDLTFDYCETDFDLRDISGTGNLKALIKGRDDLAGNYSFYLGLRVYFRSS
ncbi:uncharacterized protein BHQ10_004338 [Talaromyces amestolkiae]|uniref:Uncharacterized protein n=1 Tax=Talaromyces amestolkiae TaxID=1196081 RepID=A0A364KXN9_TALAM|nr:uncharacterized protein BHQ10_004338 [Talaromyces amestolkiae]RAO68326.1 hypothetical protein BHQ10_004338 [Talaromyces amestolkiae]